MKKIALIVLMLALVLTLSACSNKEDKQTPVSSAQNSPQGDVGGQVQQPPMQSTGIPDYSANLPANYDPASEEEKGDLESGVEIQNLSGSERAGASPVPIDPVDMPTPTPRPPLTFSYSKYVASGLGLSFESVAGYHIDESQAGIYLLTEPLEMAKDNVQVQILLQVTPVASGYKLTDLKKELQDKVKQLGSVNFKTWKPSGITGRTLLKKQGFYQDFRGVMYDETIVRGRTHVALLGDKVLTLQFICPGWYNSDYTKVYSHIRDTLKII